MTIDSNYQIYILDRGERERLREGEHRNDGWRESIGMTDGGRA